MKNKDGNCRDAAKNKYIAVKHEIERSIIDGEYKAGEKIPTIAELQTMFSIGRSTAQKVIESLDEDGIIIRRVGKGCFVKPFVREALTAEHKSLVQSAFDKAVRVGSEFGLSASDMKQIVEEAYDKNK